MMKAIWNGVVLAQSDETIHIEGNYYFPPETVHKEYFKSSDTHTVCHWKGTASYLSIEVNGEQNVDVAWFYPEPSNAAKDIKNFVAFWKGVKVEK